jgi:hypothetical protein
MSTPKIEGLGIIQDGCPMQWMATGRRGRLEAWRSALVEAMEALQVQAAMPLAEKQWQEEDL